VYAPTFSLSFAEVLMRFIGVKFALFLCALLGAFVVAQASTVEQVSLAKMLKDSELVFEGQVTQVVSRLTANKQSVETLVTIQVLDVIKGTAPGSQVTLNFAGGDTPTLHMTVSGMKPPQLNDHGIYFVETTKRLLIHPLYGWDQGHFLVKAGLGRSEMVTTRDGRPVMSLDATLAGKSPGGAFSEGVALGIRTESTSANAPALTPAQFKSALRTLKDINN
jgi:hypothetical protein